MKKNNFGKVRYLQYNPSFNTHRQPLKGWLGLFVFFAVAMTVLAISIFLGVIAVFIIPVVTNSGLGSFFSLTWLPSQGFFGIFSMVVGTIFLSMFALIVGWPLSLGVTVWLLSKSNNGYAVKIIKYLIRIMTAIPTVVYGFTAVFLLIPFSRNILGGSGFSLFSAGCILGIMIVPTMVLVIGTGLQPRLERLCPESLAVGFSRLELLLFFVVPSAPKVLTAAAVIGFGRALGDTLISLMLSGNAPQIPGHFSEGFRTITAHIALISANEIGGKTYDALFLSGAMLLSMNVIISSCLRWLGKEKTYE